MQNVPEVPFAKDHDMIAAFPPDRADRADGDVHNVRSAKAIAGILDGPECPTPGACV
jgi:hypothetical protein